MFKYVNSKLSMSQRIASIRCANGDLLIADADKAEAFSEYFSSVYSPPSANVDILLLQQANIVSPNVLFFPNNVRDAFCAAKHTYLAGSDSIPVSFWANVADTFTILVSILF